MTLFLLFIIISDYILEASEEQGKNGLWIIAVVVGSVCLVIGVMVGAGVLYHKFKNIESTRGKYSNIGRNYVYISL